ncbi:MAG: hypothetical protein QE278_10065 [Limnobacter sp.]|nr:hypothetical protein [Limnobacter sp.]
MNRFDPHLPIDSPLTAALKQSDLARNTADWVLVLLGVLGLYMLMQSQLDHEIESSILTPARIEKVKPQTQQTLKMEVFSTQRSNEYEIWADLKDLIERKRPAQGHCQIQPSRPKSSKAKLERRMNAPMNAPMNVLQPNPVSTSFELACLVYSNKKLPSNHIGVALLPSLIFMGISEASFSTSSPDNLPSTPTKNEAQAMSPIISIPPVVKPEGWIETPNGILKFDAKEERWK